MSAIVRNAEATRRHMPTSTARDDGRRAALAPKDHLAGWARNPAAGARLTSRFLGDPKSFDLRQRAGIDDLRALMTAGEAPRETLERALDELSSPDGGGDIATMWTISTRAVDTYNTTFHPDGWELDAFRKNPVVLFAHQRNQLPIGRDVGAWVQAGKALKGVTRYAPPAINPFGEQVGRAVKAGFLSAVSVGFHPLEFEIAEERDDGESFFYPIDFKRQALLEYSVVPVPANPEALIEGRSLAETLREANIDPRPFLEWCERALDGEGGSQLLVPRHLLERARKAIVPIAGGLVLMPADMAQRAPAPAAPPPDAAAAAAPAEPTETPEEELAEENAPMRCPACGWEGVESQFLIEPEPTTEEAARADELSTRALVEALERRGLPASSPARSVDAGSEIEESQLADLATRATKTALREAQKQLIERTGRLPGPG